jgi:hypothetical protein
LIDLLNEKMRSPILFTTIYSYAAGIARRISLSAVAAVEFSADPVDTWLQELGRTRSVIATVPHYIDALHLVAQSDLIAVGSRASGSSVCLCP